MSAKMEAMLAAIIFPFVNEQCVMPDNKPKLRIPKLICVIAFILNLFICQYSSASTLELERENHKYDIPKLQAKALERSTELKLLDQAIQVAQSKKWTSLMPSVGIGNNFVSNNADPRFNISWDVAEVVGGGKIRQINLDIARLFFQKLELERKLRQDVLEKVLALEEAEIKVERLKAKSELLSKRMKFVNNEYIKGERQMDTLFGYWDAEEKIEDQRLEAMDKVTIQRSYLEELVGSLDEFIALQIQR